jgi:hypothetical protein
MGQYSTPLGVREGRWDIIERVRGADSHAVAAVEGPVRRSRYPRAGSGGLGVGAGHWQPRAWGFRKPGMRKSQDSACLVIALMPLLLPVSPALSPQDLRQTTTTRPFFYGQDGQDGQGGQGSKDSLRGREDRRRPFCQAGGAGH